MIHETNEIYSKEYTTTVDSKKITKEASKNTDKCINLLKKADTILIILMTKRYNFDKLIEIAFSSCKGK
jgi:hypothetical protein